MKRPRKPVVVRGLGHPICIRRGDTGSALGAWDESTALEPARAHHREDFPGGARMREELVQAARERGLLRVRVACAVIMRAAWTDLLSAASKRGPKGMAKARERQRRRRARMGPEATRAENRKYQARARSARASG